MPSVLLRMLLLSNMLVFLWSFVCTVLSFEKGLIWVWAGDREKADVTQLPHHLFTEYLDTQNYVSNTSFCDLEIDHGLFIENVLDPAHLPFTHEGTLAKRSDATELTFTILFDNLSATISNKEEEKRASDQLATESGVTIGLPEGFYGVLGRTNTPQHPEKLPFYFLFQAPNIVRLDLLLPGNKKLVQLHFAIPVTPTRMRLNYIFVRNFAKAANMIPFSNYLFKWNSEKIIYQDLELLASQQQNLLHQAKPWNTAVSADKVGVRYRRWRQHAEQTQQVWFSGFHSLSENRKGGPVSEDIEDLVADERPNITSYAEKRKFYHHANYNYDISHPQPTNSFLSSKVLLFGVVLIAAIYFAL